MYVIYPADELILFTYGNINLIPRRRPTLDQIEGPLIPISSPNPLNSPAVRSNERSSIEPVQRRAPSRTPQREGSSTSVKSVAQSSNKSQESNQSSSKFRVTFSENKQTESTAKADDQVSSLSRERIPSINEPSTTNEPSSNEQSLTRISPTTSKSKSPKLSKLSKFGFARAAEAKQSESSRFTEEIHLTCHNPTFTRQNLRDKNFDAFFKSGEPIVSKVGADDSRSLVDFKQSNHIKPTKPVSVSEERTTPLDASKSKVGVVDTKPPVEPKKLASTLRHSNSFSASKKPSPGIKHSNSFVDSRKLNHTSPVKQVGVCENKLLVSKTISDTNEAKQDMINTEFGHTPNHYFKDSLATNNIKATSKTSLNRSTSQLRESGLPPRVDKVTHKPPKVRFEVGIFKKRLVKSPSRDHLKSAMAGSSGTAYLKDMTNPSYNEILKTHNGVTFKLVKTVSDFTESLSQLYEAHAESLQALVSNYRKKNGELRRERPNCQSSLFNAWESFLQEVEADSQGHSDIATTLYRQVSRPLLERSFHRKLQSRKIFIHRESFDTIISKTEEKLSKCRMDYKSTYAGYISVPNQQNLMLYFDSHNTYVQQLHATNSMLEIYHGSTLPQLLQELEDIYNDLCLTLSDSLIQGSEIISTKATEQSKRYDNLLTNCKGVSGGTDLQQLCKTVGATSSSRLPKKHFAPPQPPEPEDGKVIENLPPTLTNELVTETSTLKVQDSLQTLRKEAVDLQGQIRYLQDGIDTLIRTQSKALESQLYNKVNEIQESLSIKTFDLRAKQLHLSAVNAQRELFQGKVDPSSEERKMSTASGGSMKSKWLKAFRSLKPTNSGQNERKIKDPVINDMENVSHALQEYTYKKITPCDVCSEVLRGHTRQGLRCRICKANVHVDCASKLSKCQTKARLLRRQKSTSEMEPNEELNASPKLLSRQLSYKEPYDLEPEVDIIYQVLKQAGEISNKIEKKQNNTNGVDKPPLEKRVEKNIDIPTVRLPSQKFSENPRTEADILRSQEMLRLEAEKMKEYPDRAMHIDYNRRDRMIGKRSNLTVTNMAAESSSSAPHSPRRHKLDLRMKSLSLDSPESSELHTQRRKTAPSSNNSRVHSPSSPSHSRRLLGIRGLRTGSVDLPDQDQDKSLSSASTSPCPSPSLQKPHRLLPTNLYAVLYNFQARHQDELDLRAGYKVTVIDNTDPDWWKGKCLGRVGFFPSKYCTKLQAGEKVLQVTHNIQTTDREPITLFRDQIVVQIGEEAKGMVTIRAADQRTGVCPIKYLIEV